ncbi:beta-1,4-mannosyltransferase [Nematocida minor]|uniref:beta-1,4-mannosyltransferase n=1 Tax=Nematocida minor TaxID=1912983 RepID=UPI00221EFA0B|nr:beta-1,4-mannosyltransferase [Nematocida minor]KAI5189657.1 beta-1,4-mannosyltransferase [Nematocida minor]
MLVINLAPIDQSGRSLSIAQYLKKNKHIVQLISYKGSRNHTLSTSQSRMSISYIKNIKTQNKPFLCRPVLLFIKLVYITTMSILYLVRYKLSLHANDEEKCSTLCKFYSKGGTVIFVVPPTTTVLLPMLLAKLLRIRVIIDWHRINTGFMEIFDRHLASTVDNITVTQEMQKYFMSFGIKKPFLLSDMKLRKILSKKAMGTKRKLSRKQFIDYLSSKYAEYKDRLANIPKFQQIGICSTSFSDEEKIHQLLEDLKDLNIPQGGVLFITTKQEIVCQHENLQIIQVFLDYEDYQSLLEIADFGISTHQCRLDFPLKIVDYLEKGLTVLAHNSTPNLKSKQKNEKIIRYKNNKNLTQYLQKIYANKSSKDDGCFLNKIE